MTNPDPAGARTLTGAEALPFPSEGEVPGHDSPDEVLMLAIVQRDEAAFSLLYDRYSSLVYSTCLRVLADPHLAQDTTQEVFVRLWRTPESFVASRGRLLSWLMSVARNRAVDELRARGRRQRREDPGAEDALAVVPDSSAIDPQRAAQIQEQQVRVRAALAELPPEQRAALELAYFGGLTQQEIALQLHEPLGTIKTRIRLAMQKLRRLLSESEVR
ncbi:MAG TPA: sigma-70 family RNA polymerase sigma factor [Tepidiformaceae bacterium]|nr:sigma-70 family RNA polymerase sigma factor [Tepidiformaceae bacterium]